MKKNLLVTGIVLGALALSVSVAVPVSKKVANADKAQTAEQKKVIERELEAEETDTRYNILPTLKSGDFAYSQVKDKDVVLWYRSNNDYDHEGFNLMKMNVVEYEKDGTTPKTVNFTSEFATVQNADTAYTIYAFDESQADMVGNSTDYDYEQLKEVELETGMFDAGFADTEPANPYTNTVTLTTEELDVDKTPDLQYTKLTYSINGGEEKTVYAHQEREIIPDTAIPAYFTYEVQVYANAGDTIEYTVEVPTNDGSYEEYNKAVVVK